MTEERVSQCDERSIEITPSEEKNEKNERNEYNLKNLWNNIKRYHWSLRRIRERGWVSKRIFEDNSLHFPQIGEGNQFTDLRSSENLKQDKNGENHARVHDIQISKK